VHEEIRKDPTPASKSEKSYDKKYKKPAKLTYDERKARVAQKKAALAAAGDDDE